MSDRYNPDKYDPKTPEDWIRIAIGDLISVNLEHLCINPDLKTASGNILCYKCELVAEKNIKALCVALGFRDDLGNHNLITLAQRIRKEFVLNDKTFGAIENLDRFGIAARYSSSMKLSSAEIDNAVIDMKRVCNSMGSKLRTMGYPDLLSYWEERQTGSAKGMMALMLKEKPEDHEKEILRRWLLRSSINLGDAPKRTVKIVKKPFDRGGR